MNLSVLLHKVSRENPGKTALIEGDKKLSYGELWDNIKRLTRAFWKIGIRKDDKAAIILPNCKEFIFSFFALLRINAIAVPLKPAFTGFELKGIFQNCNPRVIITTPSFLDKLMPEDRELLENRMVIVLGEMDSRFRGNDKEEKPFTFKQLYEIGKDERLPEISTENNQTASINYTYRGYGYPLGAMLGHRHYIHAAIRYIKLTKTTSKERLLLVLPQSHIFTLIGCVVVPLLSAATVIIAKSYSPKRIFKAVSNYRINSIVSVPTLYSALLRNFNSGKWDISSLQVGISGGALISAELQCEIKDKMGIDVFQGYGLTECFPVTCNPGAKNKFGSLGIQGYGVEIKIVDDSGREKAINETGEIIVRCPSVMFGYYGMEKETKEVLKNGWFYTGDYGRLDEDGYLYFEGLKKRIVKVGGNTVDLTEVENTLSAHPAIRTAKVYAKPNSLWGHLLTAEVSLISDSEIDGKKIKGFCKQRLAAYKIPRTIIVKNQGAGDYAERANSAI
jgi:long-chain acyl-CoA synthetase